MCVCLSVVTNMAGQGRAARANTCPLDLLAVRSNSPLICGPIWTNQMVLSVCGDKQGRAGAGHGRAGQPLRGAGQGAISIKEILGENRGT